MSAATSAAPQPTAQATASCPKCEGVIAEENMATVQPMSRSKSRRAYCPHCDKTAVAHYELNGGVWVRSGPIEFLKGRHLEAPEPKRQSA